MKLAALADLYGPVASFRRGNQLFCIINRYQVTSPPNLRVFNTKHTDVDGVVACGGDTAETWRGYRGQTTVSCGW